jgi:hypothetical protein
MNKLNLVLFEKFIIVVYAILFFIYFQFPFSNSNCTGYFRFTYIFFSIGVILLFIYNLIINSIYVDKDFKKNCKLFLVGVIFNMSYLNISLLLNQINEYNCNMAMLKSLVLQDVVTIALLLVYRQLCSDYLRDNN